MRSPGDKKKGKSYTPVQYEAALSRIGWLRPIDSVPVEEHSKLAPLSPYISPGMREVHSIPNHAYNQTKYELKLPRVYVGARTL